MRAMVELRVEAGRARWCLLGAVSLGLLVVGACIYVLMPDLSGYALPASPFQVGSQPGGPLRHLVLAGPALAALKRQG